MHSFIYSFMHKKVIGQPTVIPMHPGVQRNFPIKTFFQDEYNLIFVFYRQGQAYAINGSDTAKYYEQKITEYDLGTLFFYDKKVLIAKSSEQIMFYKLNVSKNMAGNTEV